MNTKTTKITANARDILSNVKDRDYTQFDSRTKELLASKVAASLAEKGYFSRLAQATNEDLNESKITIDVDYICDNAPDCKVKNSKHKVKVSKTGSTTADITGEPKNVKAWLLDSGWEKQDIKDLYPEVL